MQQPSLSQRLHIDIPLCIGILILCGVGLVTLYSASGADVSVVIRQSVRIIIAFVLMCLVAQLPPKFIERWSLPTLFLGIAMLILVLLIGNIGKGAQRWIEFGYLRFQPSELMKLAVPMAVSWFLADKTLPPSIGDVMIVGLMIVVPIILIAKQPDLGTALLVMVSGCAVLFIAGMRLRLIVALTGLCIMFIPVFWYFIMHDYQKRRVLTLFDYEQDPLGAGYHIIQSMIAIGSGGFYGKGWMNGTQSHLEFLPERSTDFIFAVHCEEFGLLGVLLLIGIYLFIIGRGLYIAINAQTTYGRLLAAGLTITFFAYVLVNIGMVSGQLPVVGIPLPLVSRGGSSIVTLMIGFGILMLIHTNRRIVAD